MHHNESVRIPNCIIHFTHASSILNGNKRKEKEHTPYFLTPLRALWMYYIVLEALWSFDTHILHDIHTVFSSSRTSMLWVVYGHFLLYFYKLCTHIRNRVNNSRFLCPIENGHKKRKIKNIQRFSINSTETSTNEPHVRSYILYVSIVKWIPLIEYYIFIFTLWLWYVNIITLSWLILREDFVHFHRWSMFPFRFYTILVLMRLSLPLVTTTFVGCLFLPSWRMCHIHKLWIITSMRIIVAYTKNANEMIRHIPMSNRLNWDFGVDRLQFHFSMLFIQRFSHLLRPETYIPLANRKFIYN